MDCSRTTGSRKAGDTELADHSGLTEHIFRALYQSQGLIAIMHHRGSVKKPSGGELIRASVWIEQEIAIAAFIHQVLDRQIPVQAYAQEGIALEGVREKLILNATRFTSNEEVLQHLRRVLPGWSHATQTPKLEIKLDAKKTNRHAEATEFNLSAIVHNNSEDLVSAQFVVEIIFPARFLRPARYSGEMRDRATASHRAFHGVVKDKILLPHRQLPIYTLPYVIEDRSWEGDPSLELPVTARLYQDDKLVGFVEELLREITPLSG